MQNQEVTPEEDELKRTDRDQQIKDMRSSIPDELFTKQQVCEFLYDSGYRKKNDD